MNWIKKSTVLLVVLIATAAIAQSVVVIRSGSSTQTVTVNADGSLNVTVTGTSSSTPAKTETTLPVDADACTTPGDADCTVILASTEVVAFKQITLTIHNDGANTLTEVIVEFSPDGTTWETWDNTTFASLVTTDGSDMRSMQISGNSRRYMRVEGRSSAGTSTDVWLTMSR